MNVLIIFESGKFYLIWLDLARDRSSLNKLATMFSQLCFLRCRHEISFWCMNLLNVLNESMNACLLTAIVGWGQELKLQCSILRNAVFRIFISK